MKNKKNRYFTGKQQRQLKYQKYLKSDWWKKRRITALKKALNCCEVCKGRVHIQVHHKTYNRLGQEEDNDLIVLCERCHESRHSGLGQKRINSGHRPNRPKGVPRKVWQELSECATSYADYLKQKESREH